LVALVPQPYYLLAHHWPPHFLTSFLPFFLLLVMYSRPKTKKFPNTPKDPSFLYFLILFVLDLVVVFVVVVVLLLLLLFLVFF
jgi:hypothetical protein